MRLVHGELLRVTERGKNKLRCHFRRVPSCSKTLTEYVCFTICWELLGRSKCTGQSMLTKTLLETPATMDDRGPPSALLFEIQQEILKRSRHNSKLGGQCDRRALPPCERYERGERGDYIHEHSPSTTWAPAPPYSNGLGCVRSGNACCLPSVNL